MALPQDSCIWGRFSCSEHEEMLDAGKLQHSTATTAELLHKGARAFPKNPQTNHLNGDLRLEEKKGLSPWTGLLCVVTVEGRGKSLPHRITKPRTKTPRKHRCGWLMHERSQPEEWKCSHLVDICCGQGNRTLYVYWHCNMFINPIKKTPAAVLVSYEL